MAEITLKGNPFTTSGDLPKVGAPAPAFSLLKDDLSEATLADYSGKTVILSIFPSVDTPVCAQSVRTFVEQATDDANTVVVNVSLDLPFAQKRFCAAEGIENAVTHSAFRSTFAEDYGVRITNGPLAELCARAIVVIAPDGKVKHTELVPEIAQEPDYRAALAAAQG